MLKLRTLLIGAAMLSVATPALADPWDWIYGMSQEKAVAKLTAQGWTYDGQDDNTYFWWHRRASCVKFRAVDGVVADAEYVDMAECEGAASED